MIPLLKMMGEKRQMYEIRPGHFVYATEAEAKNYKEEA